MDYRVLSDSKWLYLILFHLLLLLLPLASFPSTMASEADVCPNGNCHYHEGKRKGLSDQHRDYAAAHNHEQSDEHHTAESLELGNCPSNLEPKVSEEHHTAESPGLVACECPLNLEPKVSEQLKGNLAPILHQRLKELVKKANTVESATQTVQTIDLLKLINASNSKWDRIRDKVHQAAQLLIGAFAEIPDTE